MRFQHLAGSDLGLRIQSLGDNDSSNPDNDVIYGGLYDDFSFGLLGNDTIYGEQGNDFLNGDGGDDKLIGGPGNDKLDGGEDNDLLEGGIGNDTLDGGWGFDTLDGGDGIDTATYDFYDGGINASLMTGIVSFPGNSTITEQLISIENIIGSLGNDRLVGDSRNNIFEGNDGNDTMTGGLGHDLLSGGDDRDFLYGNYDNDTLNGNSGNDYLNGQQGDDILIGGEGNDTLIGSTGNDLLTGGAGMDRFVFEPNHGTDIITDFNPIHQDRVAFNLSFSAQENGYHLLENATYQGISGLGVYWQTDTSTRELITLLQSWDETQFSLDDRYFENVIFPENYQEPLTRTLHNVINGTEAGEKLTGGIANDEINGLGGNDTISGGLGHDLINGGAGRDFIYGNYDNDTLNGEGGNDYLNGQEGNDILNGGEGNDRLIGLKGNDTLTGGVGRDTFGFTSTSEGIDVITDFNPLEDRISFYQSFAKDLTGFLHLEDTIFQGITGAGIYWDDLATDTDPGQLIAVLQGQNASQLSLTNSYFQGNILSYFFLISFLILI